MPLKSPGTKPRTLPGKQHPNPLPSIGKSGGRPSKEEISPLGSPGFGSPVAVFRQSPVSTPVTPGYQTSPRTEEGGVGSFREDPVKVSVILPQVMSLIKLCLFLHFLHVPSFQGPFTSAPPLHPQPAAKPPPLPPKPPKVGEVPPLPPREPSPPPPLPPRLPPYRPHTSHRSPLESRQPTMDPVFPQTSSLPPAVMPRYLGDD